MHRTVFSFPLLWCGYLLREDGLERTLPAFETLFYQNTKELIVLLH